MTVQAGSARAGRGDDEGRRPRVVVLGSLNVDTTVHVRDHPRTGETVLGRGGDHGWGGKGGNQAMAARAAGADVALVARVGDDADGRAYLAHLAAADIDVSAVGQASDASTGTALIAVNGDGDNTIIVDPGANDTLGKADLRALEGLSTRDTLLLQLEVPVVVAFEAITAGHRLGSRVVVNLSPYLTLTPAILELVDIVVVNEPEAELLAADGLVPRSLVETRGPRGARWGDIDLPAHPVPRVLDTTGAGDAFCGTLTAHLALGADPRSAVDAALAAAARTVGSHGATPPTR